MLRSQKSQKLLHSAQCTVHALERCTYCRRFALVRTIQHGQHYCLM